jgi:hypothetical protein
VGSQRKAFQGHLLAIVRSNGQAGEINLTAKTEGLAPVQVKIQTR